MKVPSIIFDVILILTVHWATATLLRLEGRQSPAVVRWAPLAAAAVVAFQPAVLYDSAVWAQTDSAITAAMLAAIVLAASGRSWRRPYNNGGTDGSTRSSGCSFH